MRLNRGSDLAEVCVNEIESSENEICIGGPTIYTYKEIASLAFYVLNKKTRISRIPIWLKNLMLLLLRTFTSSRTYGPVEFLMTALTVDGVGFRYGKKELHHFMNNVFKEHYNQL